MDYFLSTSSYTIVTGATSGIGKALARQIASKQGNLICIGRCKSSLDILSNDLSEEFKVKIIVRQVDLADINQTISFIEEISDSKTPICGLINSAGYANVEGFHMLSRSDRSDDLFTHLNSFVELNHFVLNSVLGHGKGFILNVASTAGLKPSPAHILYSANKSFIYNFTLGLNIKYSTDSLLICCLCPGSTRTAFFKNAGIALKKEKFDKLPIADFIADVALEQMLRGRPLVIPTLKHKLQYFFIKMIPLFALILIQKCRG
ncbi:MAG: SDR family NAD(P)-dependent oxidoreductase [Bacteriovoracaceae bacterium]|nr:SDR family NAD(P)-dependent oxidoreductase [Bacteriovoracaceae bacterium]